MFMMGNSEKFTSCAVGPESSFWGRSRLALSMASRTRCKASDTSTSGLNSTRITDTSCKAFDLMRLTPEMDFNCFSMGLLMVFSTSAGAVPK